MSSKQTLLLVLCLTGCAGEEDSDLNAVCEIVALAGDDRAVLFGESVDLLASHEILSDCASGDISYRWSLEEVPDGSFLDDLAFGQTNDTPAPQTTFVPDALGTYVISLVAHDSVSESPPDLLLITATTDNPPPSANAGTGATAPLGLLYTFDGTASADPDGEPLTYDWDIASVPDGGDIVLYDEHSANASFVPNIAGTYVFSLRVSDGTSWSSRDYVALVATEVNGVPVANAGQDVTYSACDSSHVNLNGWGSFDPDADSLLWSWEVLEVPDGANPEAVLSDLHSPNPTLLWEIPGEYEFSLQVSDGILLSPYDLVAITTTDLGENTPPIADAGSDSLVAINADCESTGSGVVCEECRSVSLELSSEASSDADGDALSTHWTSTELVEILEPTAPSTDLVVPPLTAYPGVATDYVFQVELSVADCDATDTDTRLLTIRCTGTNP